MNQIDFRVAATLFKQGKKFDLLADALMLLAALALFLLQGPVILCAIAVIALGIAHKYFSVRVALDAKLFDLMAEKETVTQEDAQQLDDALSKMSPKERDSSRSWESRIKGSRLLFRRQSQCLLCQLIIAIFAGLIYQL